MEALGYKWPNTGRKPAPEGTKVEIHSMHAKWADLVWYRAERDVWVYVSTLPIEAIKPEEVVKIVS